MKASSFTLIWVCSYKIQLGYILKKTKKKHFKHWKSPWGSFFPTARHVDQVMVNATLHPCKALREFYRGCNLCVRQRQLLFIQREMRQVTQWGKNLTVFVFFLPLLPALSPSASVIFETVLSFSLLDTPHLHTAPGPLVECCIVLGLWRKGIPGHSKNTHTHTRAHTSKHTHQHTQIRTHRQIQLLRAITTLWQMSKSKTSGVGRPSV